MTERFPGVSGLLLKGPPGVGKLEWSLELIKHSLKEGKKVVMVCVDYPPEAIKERALRFDIDLGGHEGEDLVFIDCVTLSLSNVREGTPSRGTLYVTSLSNVEGIGMSISKAANQLGGSPDLFVYSLSPLFLHNSTSVLMKFFQIVTSKLRSWRGFGVFALHDDAQEGAEDTLAMLADGVVEMRFKPNLQREMRIHHIKGVTTSPKWVQFDIGGEFLEVVLTERGPGLEFLSESEAADELL
ncbi:MAG: ATPase domain-containing protein [Thermoplasmata archaeon]